MAGDRTKFQSKDIRTVTAAEWRNIVSLWRQTQLLNSNSTPGEEFLLKCEHMEGLTVARSVDGNYETMLLGRRCISETINGVK